jgi:hypothetical protein
LVGYCELFVKEEVIMRRFMHGFLILAMLAIAPLPGTVYAYSIQFTVTGICTYASDTDWLGDALDPGDITTATGQFDSSDISSLGVIQFGEGYGNTLTWYIGDVAFVESDDVDFDMGYPMLYWEGPLGIAMEAIWPYSIGVVARSGVGVWSINSGGGVGSGPVTCLYEGEWSSIEYSSPVPEPATIFLLGSGLVGLAGIGRRKFR